MTQAFHFNQKTGDYLALRPMKGVEVVGQAKAIVAAQFEGKTYSVNSPDSVKDFLLLHLAPLEHEEFGCIFLDNRHRILKFESLFRGTVDSCSVHPREVVKAALQCNAAAVIFVHNHPSGNPEPSKSDTALTDRLKDALGLIDTRVVDHLIVGGTKAVSFAERGLI